MYVMIVFIYIIGIFVVPRIIYIIPNVHMQRLYRLSPENEKVLSQNNGICNIVPTLKFKTITSFKRVKFFSYFISQQIMISLIKFLGQ